MRRPKGPRSIGGLGEAPVATGTNPAFQRLRWVVLLVPVGIYFFSYFHRIAPVVVVEDVMAAFAASAASVGLLTAVYP